MSDPAVVHEVNVAGPGTHVLVIGVGAYPHLEKGSGARAANTYGLKQLTSPPISARRVARWFMEDFSCLERPLGSVALLLSEPGAALAKFTRKDGQEMSLPRAGLAQTQKAVSAWLQRAAHPNSLIILYFCGHGFSAGLNNFYLLREFGKDEDRAMEAAINYERFVSALATRPASNQMLVFDACRQESDVAVENQTGGASLIDAIPGGRSQIAQRLGQCVIFSTEPDTVARGAVNAESLCASALIRGLDGAAALEDGEQWYVSSRILLNAITDFQMRTLGETEEPQRGDTTRFALLRLRKLDKAPRFPVFISLANKQPLAKADITCRDFDGAVQPLAQKFDGSELETKLGGGQYEFSVSMNGVPLPPKRRSVGPTHAEVKV